MKVHLAAIVAAMLLAFGLTQDAAGQTVRPRQRPGEFGGKFRPAVNLGQAREKIAGAGKNAQDGIGAKRLHAVALKVKDKVTAAESAQIRAALSQLDVVERVEPNYLYYASDLTPDDPRTKAGDLWYLDKIQAPKAWEIQHDSPDVIVAV